MQRLIDAEALKMYLNMKKQYYTVKIDPHHYKTGLLVDDVMDSINRQPTVAVSDPAVRSHWTHMSDADGDYYVCNECFQSLPRHGDAPTYSNPYPKLTSVQPTKFCPNCGACMIDNKPVVEGE